MWFYSKFIIVAVAAFAIGFAHFAFEGYRALSSVRSAETYGAKEKILEKKRRDIMQSKADNSSNPVIPRHVLFGNPDKISPSLSPEGEYLAYLAPLEGVLNVHVAPADNLENAEAITQDTNRGIRRYGWTFDNQHLIYLQDTNGDENDRLYKVDIKTRKVQLLAGSENTKVLIEKLSHLHPNEALISMNQRDQSFFDLYKINIATGALTEVYKNEQFCGFVTDNDFHLRFAYKPREDGGFDIYKMDDLQPKYFMTVAQEDAHTTAIMGFNKSRDVVYMLDSAGRNTAALVALDLNKGEKQIIYENDKADIRGLLIHPTEHTIQAAKYEYLREEIVPLDQTFAKDYQNLKSLMKGDVIIVSFSLDYNVWIVADIRDNAAAAYYKYDRNTKKLVLLFRDRNALQSYKLSKMHPVVVGSRDGLELISYLTLPVDNHFDATAQKAKTSSPLVLWVHGGPTARDSWGYDPIHQWLSNRGYAVISVNYRGSTGFGKEFINAGNGEWGRKMHEDLLDVVNWAIDRGITTKDSVAIAGGSYGGYAALAGLTFSPDVFTCAIDIVGPSNLVTLLESVPQYWKPLLFDLEKKLGGSLRTEEGRKALAERSPINFVDNIKKPLLIGHGANDPRVKQSESDQIFSLMQKKGLPVSYILYPEEGHGFAKPENRMSFYGFVERFLSEWLGGRFEAIEQLEKANYQVKSNGVRSFYDSNKNG